jgi:hypothetical protein
VAEDVDSGQAQAVDETGGVGCHGDNRVGGHPGALAHGGIVEQDDLTSRCECVGDGRVEVVAVTHGVPGEDQRGASLSPRASVGEAHAADVEELGGRCSGAALRSALVRAAVIADTVVEPVCDSHQGNTGSGTSPAAGISTVGPVSIGAIGSNARQQ